MGPTFGVGVLVRAVATSLVTPGGYTFMNLAKMAAEVEFESLHTASRAINALRCDMIGMIHLAPFLGNLDAHFVIVLHRGDANLTGLAVDAIIGNHFIHRLYLIFMQNITLFQYEIWQYFTLFQLLY